MENSNWRFGMTDKNTAGVDLDKLEAEFNARPDVPSVIVGRDLLAKLFALARRAEPSVAAGDKLRGVSLDEALYALDLVINKMNVPGLSGQMAYAKEVLVRATLASPAVSQMDGAFDSLRTAATLDTSVDKTTASTIEERRVTDMLQSDWAVNPKYYRAQARSIDAELLLKCPKCGADRSKEPCGNPQDCGMIGTAHHCAQAPSRDAAPGDVIAIAARIFDFKPHKQSEETKVKYLQFAAALAQQGASHAANAGEDTERDAARWRAFVSSSRIRPLGSVGLNDPMPGHYAHMGLEIWTAGDWGDESTELGKRLAKQTKLGAEWLTKYADIAIEAQRAAIASSAAQEAK
jgi:hypothetical protein